MLFNVSGLHKAKWKQFNVTIKNENREPIKVFALME